MRYLINIQRVGDQYHGRVRSGDGGPTFDLTDIQLGAASKVEINGYVRTLGEVVESLVYHRVESIEADLDEIGQLAVGQHLYAETFGRLKSAGRALPWQGGGTEVRIVTADEHIARLPWVLLASDGAFLSANGWSVALSSREKLMDCALPPSPKVLLVMPEPRNAPTKAKTHLEDIVQKLSSANSLHTPGRNLEVAHTWEQFLDLARSFAPHVIYYYGHGVGDFNSSSLLFVTGERRDAVEKPIIDFTNGLLNAPGLPPRLVYLNCCQGDTGGLLGAGRQLGGSVPAVISNCTAAHIGTAQRQGLTLLESIIMKATPPHVAVAEMRRDMAGLGLSFRDVRWMTPVLHCHYDTWRAELPRPQNRIERDPDWRLKLNRREQFDAVFSPAVLMLSHHSPRALAYIWYGQEGQGVGHFNQRVKVELQRYCTRTGVRFREVNIEWPSALPDFSSSMEFMLTSAFGVKALDEIAGQLNAELAGGEHREALLYIRPRPLSPIAVNTQVVKKYLAWWNARVVPLLTGSKSYALIGLPFIVENPGEFASSLSAGRVNDWDFSHTGFKVLDEMGCLVRRDLIEFLQNYDIVDLPVEPRNRAIDSILKETRGEYELTLGKVNDIERLAWNCYGAEESHT
jgi:hypothetical protein